MGLSKGHNDNDLHCAGARVAFEAGNIQHPLSVGTTEQHT